MGVFSDVMSTIYSIGYSTLNVSKLFTIERGQGELFEGLRLIIQGGRGVPLYLFIYSIVQNDPELLDFGLINNLPFSRFSPALAKMILACAKGYGSGFVFLNLQ
jgi:hypothetical protein